MPVTSITTMDEYNAILEKSKEKLVVIDFTATWCGPCRFIGPIFHQLSDTNTDVEFISVDVDVADSVAAHCGIQAMPTFQYYKGGEKIDEVMGADQAKIEQLIAKHK